MPSWRFTPTRGLAGALLVLGAALVWVNRAAPDESRPFGVLLVVAALVALAWPERPLPRAAVQICAVVALFLLGGELTLRRENERAQRAYADALVHFVDDPLLRYELKPHTRGTNARGMLDVERDLPRTPGADRIACVGDSVGGDFTLPSDNVCAALGRELARRRGHPVEALNFSVPGYNTMQEARAFERKALPFAPDALIVLYVLNDPYPDLAISHMLPGHLKLLHALAGGVRAVAGRRLGLEVDPFFGTLALLYHDARSWHDVVVAGFDRIAAAAAPRHIPVVVAVFPLFVFEGPEGDRRFAATYAQVVAEAERHGFIGVDLSRAAFAGEPLAALLKPSRDPIHPNAHAHQLAAAAIARALPSPPEARP